jgi:signal peptide peptidase SppA
VNYPHIAQRVFHTPLMIYPDKLAEIMGFLGPRLFGSAPEANRYVGNNYNLNDEGQLKWTPYQVTPHGVVNIPVIGTLVSRGVRLGESSGVTSYESLEFQLKAARDNPKVNRIILDIESGGGEVSGCFSLCSLIRDIRASKPVIAHVKGYAFSAAYAVASSCSEIVTSESASLGSIGVYCQLQDLTKMMENAGVKITTISAGEHKADINPFVPLTPEAHERMQMLMNDYYEQFLSSVEQGRGSKLTAHSARTVIKSDIFTGQKAISLGLSDRIGTFDSLFTPPLLPPSKGNHRMTDTLSKAEHEAALATALAAAQAQAKASVEAVHARYSAIINDQRCATCLPAALALAAESREMSAEAVGAFAQKHFKTIEAREISYEEAYLAANAETGANAVPQGTGKKADEATAATERMKARAQARGKM